MFKTYFLKDILAFFQRQVKGKYVVIEAIVNLIEFKSDFLSESEKEKVILETLRKYGLFEGDYEGDRTYLENITPIPEQEKKPEEEIVWEKKAFETQIELYNIRLLNGVVEFKNFMN
jgi:hypothetical protein